MRIAVSPISRNITLKTFNILVASLLVLFGGLAAAPLAAAQSVVKEQGIGISPTKRTIKADPGQKLSGSLTIVNSGDTPYDFILYARPYSVKDNKYDSPDFTNPAPNADLYTWVRFAQTRYSIAANKSLDVSYEINVPTNASPGGHYGVIFAETQPKKDKNQKANAVISKKRVGSLFYMTVSGNVKLDGQSLGGNIPFWQNEAPLRAEVTAKNTGNTDFVDTVTLTVRDIFGAVKYQARTDYNVLPDTTRTMPIVWAQSNWFGVYNVEVSDSFLDKTNVTKGYVLMMPRYMPVSLLVMVVLGAGLYVLAKRKK